MDTEYRITITQTQRAVTYVYADSPESARAAFEADPYADDFHNEEIISGPEITDIREVTE